MLINRSVITVKIESGGYGVDPTPAGTDAVLVEDLTPPSSEGLRMIERPAVRTNLAPLQPIYGGRLASITFKAEIKGSGSAGTAPELDALFRSCALAATTVPATSVTYEPASTGHESCAIWFYLDGTLHKMTGCRGDVNFALETGNKPYANFTMTGHVTNPTDTALVSPTYDSTVPTALINIPFAVGGYSAVINAINFDLGAQLSMPPSISATDGYGEIQITKFDPKGSFDPENVLVATNDYYGDFTSGTTLAVTTGAIGGTAGNIVQFDWPVIAYNDIAHGDRDGISTLETPFTAHDSSGDDFISIAFT